MRRDMLVLARMGKYQLDNNIGDATTIPRMVSGNKSKPL